MADAPSRKKTKTTATGLVIAILIGGYTMFRPAINQATGWNLPAIAQQEASVAATKVAATADRAETTTTSPVPSTSKDDPSKPGATKNPPAPRAPTQRGPLADRMSPSKSASARPPTDGVTADKATTDSPPKSDPSLKYGLLREIGPERYLSPAGLLYAPGSAEGHRLEHLKRHTADQPNRPGKHGVFDGGMEGALTTIEKAFEKAKAKQRTTTEEDGDRTIYTVDMGKRIGYIGGREGNQKRKPMARRIRMVLEGNRVITAFPL
ncbi:hypothetical protein [Neorhodopirellula pilleata]|uniref:Uncharacterized protein n=1 Tax=Neorhodopirellula pilleata TaxID=2714738 RepID=A0A5C6AH83_9BACT|nr:hypothetical protein [Neorhodopirellula pilleata]TWT97523.1 hypothetical protein Pla100_26770 [Neorhodopirellula pilleata]